MALERVREMESGVFLVRDFDLERETVGPDPGQYPMERFGTYIQPMICMKDGDGNGYGNAVNEYYERGKPVDDFKLPEPKMTVNHVADLCVCQHSRAQHHQVLGTSERVEGDLYGNTREAEIQTEKCSGKRNGAPCKCTRLNPVSSKSKHAYQRGMKVKASKVSDLKPGDRVLAGWSGSVGKVRLTDVKTGALVVEIVGKRPALPDDQTAGLHWSARPWVVTTELGETVKQTGGTSVCVVRG